MSKLSKYYFQCAITSVILFTLFYNLENYSSATVNEYYKKSKLTSDNSTKFILIWTSTTTEPFKFLGLGRNMFLNVGCSLNNCYLASRNSLLNPKDAKDFDVILFHGPELPRHAELLPHYRTPHQKYVFASLESPVYYPVCNKMYNNYFNWTWTYKLNSDEYFGYIVVRDKEGKVIGPKQEMHWDKVEDMMPINDTLKAKLSSKKIAAAWIVSNCHAPSGRDGIAKQLQTELVKYNMTLDIFGRCGTKKCPKANHSECLRKLETDYYFYLSFENSLSEDYVTEKLLNALNHYAVPIVYGGANYTRFMPDGIYLYAQQSNIKELAKNMVDIINDKEKYYDFFRWHNHYSYSDGSESPETDSRCSLCALVNNKEKIENISIYEDFVHWWSPSNKCH